MIGLYAGNHKYGGNKNKFEEKVPINTMIEENFIDKELCADRDDWIGFTDGHKQQEYLGKDYRKNLEWIFPTFDHTTIEPQNCKSKTEMNKMINEIMMNDVDEEHWNNKTLSYTRKDGPGKQLIDIFIKNMKKIGYDKMNMIDCTGNIGNDSIQAALRPEIEHVYSFEMQRLPCDRFKNNVALYDLNSKITINCERFGYLDESEEIAKFKYDKQLQLDETPTFVILDPPFELGNSPGNFNMSISSIPIEMVVDSLLDKVDMVIVTSPLFYKYNLQYKKEKKHRVIVYYLGKKNVKIYAISKNEKFDDMKFYRIQGAFIKPGSKDRRRIGEYKLIDLVKE